jgi:chromosomal replication initiator protein
MWFEGDESIVFDGNRVQVFAANAFSLSRLQTRFSGDLRETVHRIAGPETRIEFATRTESEIDKAERLPGDPRTSEVSSDFDTSTESEIDSDSGFIREKDPQTFLPFHQPEDELRASGNPASRRTKSNRPKARYVKSYWFGNENRLARASVEQVFDCPGQFSPLLLYGPTGCGKSHLLEAIVNDYRRRLRRSRCVYLSAEQFTTEFISSLRGGSGLPMFRRRYRDLDILAIDDIQFFSSKRATLGEFLQTVDHLARAGKQVVVTADRPPVELEGLGADLAARLTGGLTCPLQYPGFDGRLEIIEQICAQRNFKLPMEVRELIAQHMTRDVRRITGAINRLLAVSTSLQEKVTMHLAQDVLGDLLAFSSVGTTIAGIEQAVCDFCGVKSNELRSSSRRKRVSVARMLAMYLARQHTGAAFSEIGEHFGNRKHSTAIAAQKKVAAWLEDSQSISLPNANYPADEVIRRIESILRIG